MSSRSPLPGSAGLGGFVVLAGLLLATSCVGAVEVTAPTPSGDAAAQCDALISALPGKVAGQDARDVSPGDAPAAAWGDPAIVLRCGVEKPEELDDASPCLVVDDVGWLAVQDGAVLEGYSPPEGDVVFTTIGRSVYIELTVPDNWAPQSDALVDLAAAINATTDNAQPCLRPV